MEAIVALFLRWWKRVGGNKNVNWVSLYYDRSKACIGMH